MAEEAKAKADAYKASLESYQEEIKTASRTATEADTEKMQGIQTALLTELNRHTKIYQQIYGGK